MRTKIHYIVPTCAPKIMQKKLLPSLKEFAQVRELVSFGFVFQRYSKEEIQMVLDECQKYGLDCRYIVKEYPYENGLIPVTQMRDDAAQLNPTAEIFGCIDDDSIFSNKYPYAIADVVKDIIEYFEIHPNCGCIMVTGHEPQGKIVPNIYNQLICIELGEYIRNIYDGHIVPKEISQLVGCAEDVFVEKTRIADGYYSAICHAKCGEHYEPKTAAECGAIVYGWGQGPIIPGTVRHYLDNQLRRVEFDYAALRRSHTLPQAFIVTKKQS